MGTHNEIAEELFVDCYFVFLVNFRSNGRNILGIHTKKRLSFVSLSNLHMSKRDNKRLINVSLNIY